MIKRSEMERKPLQLGALRIWPPVVLAPMAGVTNPPFRALCRDFGAGLYVSEMITARPLVERNEKTWKLAEFGHNESPRSIQLYGIDPYHVGEAVRMLVGEGRVDHIDMNFGCPVRKVTRRGGGAALPAKRNLLRAIVRSAVASAESVPVTIKFRIGIDEHVITHLETGKIAEDEGCAAVSLHARTAAQLYDGAARWEAIAELKDHVQSIPVLGNGDIWEASDAIRMMHETGCDGVVVGRGCLGRPWLFRDLAAAFAGQPEPESPRLGEVGRIMFRHARLLAEWLGEAVGLRSFRKHATWYTKGFRGSAQLRQRLVHISSLAELKAILATLDADEPFPEHAKRISRGKSGGTQTVTLPPGYLDHLEDAAPPDPDAEVMASGG